MTENIDDLAVSLNINKVLVSILETMGSVSVSTSTFMDAGNSDKELVVEYDEESLSLTFSLKGKNE
jgi:hypothetical protein